MKEECPGYGCISVAQDRRNDRERPLTVDAYIRMQDESVQPRLYELRDILRSALPYAQECISWAMPTYRKGRDLIHFAAAKKHIGLYPGGEATAVFAEELSGYDISRGTIRLPYDEELPAELIVKIAKWCCIRYGK